MNRNRVWYISKTSIKSADTAHQILMYGTLSEIKHLKKTIGTETLNKLFLDFPKKIYTQPAFNFVKKFILDIKTSVDEKKYIKSSPRVTR